MSKNPTMVVQAWMDLRKATFRYRSESCIIDGSLMRNADVLDAMIVSCQRSGLHMTKDKLSAPFRMWKESRREEYVEQKRQELCREFDEDTYMRAHQEMTKFIKLLTGEEKDLDIAAMEHFIWQVKRKLKKKEVLWHLMPILYGRQGTGKTTLVSDLLKPLEEMWQKEDFKMFKDSRRWYGFKKYYVMFFDEMSDAKRTDAENVKRFMSSGEVSHRPLHSNEMESMPNNSVFIGATNKPLRDLIRDDEMRRFWQINVLPPDEVRANWPALSKIDFNLLWDSAHEDQESPIVPYMKDLEGAQRLHSTRGAVQRFVDERLDVTGTTPHTAEACWLLFTRWCEDSGEDEVPVKKNTFLKELKGSVNKDQRTGSMSYYFKVKPNE